MLMRSTTAALLVMSLAATFTPSEVTAKLYKWVDADGNITYSERKPPNVEAETLKIPGVSNEQQAAARDALDRSKEEALVKDKDRAFKAQVASEMKDREERLAKNCEIARQNLRILRDAPRIKDKDADGNVYYLDENAVSTKMDQTKSQIADYCK